MERGNASGQVGLARMRRVGLAVLGLQLVGMLVWSTILANRFALTWDFSIYHQAWWLIGHGHLDPFDTLNGFPFWASHGELLMWPLALTGLVWPHAVTLLWIQDAGMFGAELVAYGWLCDFAGGIAGRSRRAPSMLAATGLVLLVADPWIYWAISFDFHLEAIGILFVLLAARDLYRCPGRLRIFLWVGLGLSCGDVVATYLVGIGISGAVAGRHWRRTGLLVAVMGIIWTIVLTVLGANRGSGLASGYGYLANGAGAITPAQVGLSQLATGILSHPQHVLSVLWQRRLDMYAAVSAGGVIGAFSPWVVVGSVLVLLENGLNRNLGFIVPGFQDTLLFVLVPVGTVAMLAALLRRRPTWAAVIVTIVTVNALLWGAIWIPRTATQWLRVSPPTSAVLASVQRQIAPFDEAVVSQGVAGRFSGRRWMYAIQRPTSVPVRTSPVWVVLAPRQGIETAGVKVTDALIAELAGPLHAKLVAHQAGVWAFRWIPPPGTRTLTVPAAVPTVEAWTDPGSAGRATTQGPSTNWRAVATGASGYVVSGDYWREPPGHYVATAVLSSTVPVNVEVWNSTGNVLLARRSIPPTNGSRAVTVPVDATHPYPAHTYRGAGPFSILPTPPPPGNQLEIRVYTSGGGLVSVSSLELVRQ